MTDPLHIVMTCAPLRLSFTGGGTDLPDFYSLEGGAVISTTIDKFVYVTVKSHGEVFEETYRLNYYDSEHTGSLDEIRNEIMRECLRLVPVDPPLYVNTVADVPSSSGLGSSGAFAVSLLHALHIKRGEECSPAQLAEEACHIEMNVLAHPVGKQDQYAAAFGGLNQIIFHRDGSVSIEPQRISERKISQLFEHIVMFWTRQSRAAKDILEKQRDSTPDNMENLKAIKDHCSELKSLLANDSEFDPNEVGRILDDTWKLKRNLTDAISNGKIDDWYERAMNAGAAGGKISGAGGGGFLMLIVPPERQEAVAKELHDIQQVKVNYEASGSRVLSVHKN